MKKIFLILVVLLMFSVSNSLAQDAIKPHRIKNFFPKGEALLDGYLVDYSQWKRYSAFNKALFIKEYIMELEDEFNVVIKFRRWGLGPFDKYIDEKIKKEEDKIIVYNFIREFLKEQCAFPSTESGCDDLYKYDTNDVPEVFFFPISLSRWDGTKIDVMSWGKLDSLLGT